MHDLDRVKLYETYLQVAPKAVSDFTLPVGLVEYAPMSNVEKVVGVSIVL